MTFFYFINAVNFLTQIFWLILLLKKLKYLYTVYIFNKIKLNTNTEYSILKCLTGIPSFID